MLDNELFTLLIDILARGEIVANLPPIAIVQAYQPTQQGIGSTPTAYLHKVSDHRLGFPYRADTWDPVIGQLVHLEVQDYETTFQLSALSTQKPATPMQLTASDIVNQMAYILQSSSTIEKLNAQGVGMLRIQDIRNAPFLDDRDRFEFSPSLDFTVQHKQIVTTIGIAVVDVTFELVPV